MAKIVNTLTILAQNLSIIHPV